MENLSPGIFSKIPEQHCCCHMWLCFKPPNIWESCQYVLCGYNLEKAYGVNSINFSNFRVIGTNTEPITGSSTRSWDGNWDIKTLTLTYIWSEGRCFFEWPWGMLPTSNETRANFLQFEKHKSWPIQDIVNLKSDCGLWQTTLVPKSRRNLDFGNIQRQITMVKAQRIETSWESNCNWCAAIIIRSAFWQEERRNPSGHLLLWSPERKISNISVMLARFSSCPGLRDSYQEFHEVIGQTVNSLWTEYPFQSITFVDLAETKDMKRLSLIAY